MYKWNFKRMLSLLLCLALCASPAFSFAEAALVAADAGEKVTDFALGDTLDGFTVTSVGAIDAINAKEVLLTHDKTGARVICLLNDDPNLGFSVCYHTEPVDNSGMLHILEHAVCASSTKYPGNDVFFDSLSKAYITDMNAWTSLSSTNYYVTSMSEDQLAVLADFYLSCAADSLLNEVPQYFSREGWRYEMATLDDPITINGIVYSEMQGYMGDLWTAAVNNTYGALFPDTYQGYISGGLPEDIPSLSYEQLIDFYHQCYSPSNSLTMLYGDIDVDRFLKLLDGDYFSKAEKVEVSPISKGQSAFDQPREFTYSFPVSADSTETGSTIIYMTALTDEASSNFEEYAVWDGITSLLVDESSPLKQALNDSGIASQYSLYIDRRGTQLILVCYAYDADPARSEDYKSILMDQLTAMCDSGLDMETLGAYFDSADLSNRLARNSGNVASNEFNYLTWIQETGDTSCLDPRTAYEQAKAECTEAFVADQIHQWIIDNPHAVLTTTTPEPGLLEKNAQALADTLAAKKSAMTDAEKQQLVDDTAAFTNWNDNSVTPDSTLEKIDVVDPQTVNTDITEHAVTDETIGNGIRVMTAQAGTDMTFATVLFDQSKYSVADMQKLNMLSYIIGCSTAAHTQQEITRLSCGLVNGLSVSLNAQNMGDGAGVPYLGVSWYMPREKAAESTALVFEMLESTDITANLSLLINDINSAEVSYSDEETIATGLMVQTAFASSSQLANLRSLLSGMSDLETMKQAVADAKADPTAFVSSLEALRAGALAQEGTVVMLAGDPDGTAKETILAELAKLPLQSAGREDGSEWNKTSDKKSTAFIGGGEAEYATRGINLSALGVPVDGTKLLLCGLISNKYTTPELRYKGGAYDGSMTLAASTGNLAFTYYRGSDALSADSVILAAGDFLSGLKTTQNELDSYKLPIIAAYVASSGELKDGMAEMRGHFTGMTREGRLQIIEQIRQATVDDVKQQQSFLKDVLENSGFAALITPEHEKAAESRFDQVIQLP